MIYSSRLVEVSVGTARPDKECRLLTSIQTRRGIMLCLAFTGTLPLTRTAGLLDGASSCEHEGGCAGLVEVKSDGTYMLRQQCSSSLFFPCCDAILTSHASQTTPSPSSPRPSSQRTLVVPSASGSASASRVIRAGPSSSAHSLPSAA